MPPANPSTQRFSGLSTLPVASATKPTSSPPSTSTAADSTSCPPPTQIPECPPINLPLDAFQTIPLSKLDVMIHLLSGEKAAELSLSLWGPSTAPRLPSDALHTRANR